MKVAYRRWRRLSLGHLRVSHELAPAHWLQVLGLNHNRERHPILSEGSEGDGELLSGFSYWNQVASEFKVDWLSFMNLGNKNSCSC